MASMDWEWWAFREGTEAQTEPLEKKAHGGGFQGITSLTCPSCDTARYSVWIFTGGGAGSPTQAEKMLAAVKDLGELLLKHCPDHPPFVKKV
jgi:hypothetical protein